MLRSQEQLGAWVRNHCGAGITLWSEALAAGPRFYVNHPDHRSLGTFFHHYAKWEQWVVDLDAKLRKHINHAEMWLALIARRFDLDRPLRFTMRRNSDKKPWTQIDLSLREAYAEAGQDTEDLRALMGWSTESPTWSQVSEASKASIRRFESGFAERVGELSIVGEPGTPVLDEACTRFSMLAHIDSATVKIHLVQAESLFLEQRWKPAAAMMRAAIEQVVLDAYQHLLTIVPAAPVKGFNGKCGALGSVVLPSGGTTVPKECSTYVYGVFALLSGIGSHAGDIVAARGERAWHSALVAIGELADHL